jgi:hypothetical protein
MDELTNLLKNINITEQLSKKIFSLVNADLDRIVNQMISDNHTNYTNTKVYSLFENIIHFSYEELNVLHIFLQKNGYHILQTKLKNTGLYYNVNDLQTFIDYYNDDVYNYMQQIGEC